MNPPRAPPTDFPVAAAAAAWVDEGAAAAAAAPVVTGMVPAVLAVPAAVVVKAVFPLLPPPAARVGWACGLYLGPVWEDKVAGFDVPAGAVGAVEVAGGDVEAKGVVLE